jgi:hypothetical protein
MIREGLKSLFYMTVGYIAYRIYAKKHLPLEVEDVTENNLLKKSLLYRESELESLPEEIKSNFTCNISYGYFKIPVTTPDGITFDYENIKEWLSNHNTCPLTKKELRLKDLVFNENLASAIEFFILNQRKNSKK